MKNGIATVMFVLVCGAAVSAAPRTWTGQISDSVCGAKHMSMGSQKMTDRECTEMCIKANGKYVFASPGKLFQIADQKDAALATHAGHTVKLTGELKGETIAVTKIEMAKMSTR